MRDDLEQEDVPGHIDRAGVDEAELQGLSGTFGLLPSSSLKGFEDITIAQEQNLGRTMLIQD